MGFKGVEKNRGSLDAISPEGTGQSVARHGSAGKDFTQIESRRDDTMGSSHADSLAPEVIFFNHVSSYRKQAIVSTGLKKRTSAAKAVKLM
jgi:hypothetical protein